MEIRDILTWIELITYIISIIVQILIHKSDRQKEKLPTATNLRGSIYLIRGSISWTPFSITIYHDSHKKQQAFYGL